MPKVFRWTRWEHRLLRAGAVLFLAFAVGLAVWGFSELDKSARLDDVGVEVPAQLVRVSVDDSGESTTSTLHVRFVQRGDARIETTAEITYDGDFADDRPGAVRRGVRIEYDPDDPQLVRLAGEDPDRGTGLLVGAALCLVVGLGAAGFAVYGWRNRDRTI